MTVAELIRLLQGQPPTAVVMLPNGRTPNVIYHESVLNSTLPSESQPHPGFVSLT